MPSPYGAVVFGAMIVLAAIELSVDLAVSAHSVDQVALCVKQVEEAFKGYTIPSAVETYSDRFGGWFTGGLDKISKVDWSKLPEINSEECHKHMDNIERILAKVPCDEQISSTHLIDEYEFRLQESEILGKILLGSLICRDLLEPLELS